MRSNDSMESMLRKLRYPATAGRREQTLQNIFNVMDEPQEQAPAASRVHIGIITMNTRTTRLALAAAVVLIVLGGLTFRPFGVGGKDQWWLAPPAAWGRELSSALDTIKAVSCREQTVFTAADGSQHPSSTWHLFYVSSDRYRRDIYDGQVLREIQWYVPDGDGMIQHYIRFDLGCYGALRHEGSFGTEDPVERMRFAIGLLDKADTVLDQAILDGRNCIGFEIRGDGLGNHPDLQVLRVWYDVRTRLPVRMERVGRPAGGHTVGTPTTVLDHFTYDSQLPADTFLPQAPPQGFINAHPDDLPRQ